MKYCANVDGQTLEVDIEGDGDSLSVVIDGEQFPVSMRQVSSPSLFSMILGNDSHELFVEHRDGEYLITIAGELIAVKVQGERISRSVPVTPKTHTEESEIAIRAPMPGMVVSIAVMPGSSVTEGSALLVLEAMKMLNELRAPKSGLVKSVNIQQGDVVESGQVLVLLTEALS